MNSLDRFKYKQLNDPQLAECNGRIGFNVGFDAVIAFELPVKFAEWKDWRLADGNLTKIDEKHYQWGAGEIWNNKQLYTYWIENIFKAE